LARRVLEIPLQRAVVRIERERRARVERAVERGVAAARRHPRLRLRDAPVSRVEIGGVGARDPRVAARAVVVLHVAPGIGAGLVAGCDGAEAPELVAVLRVVRADEALLLAVARAIAEALHDLALDHDRAALAPELAFGPVADDRFPDGLAGARVERDEARVAGRDEDFVVVDREPAQRGVRDVRADAVLPEQLAPP